jgi:hypothetical protein
MKTIKFFVYWGIALFLFYAWTGLGHEGAFNVLAVWMLATATAFLLAQFLPDDVLIKGIKQGSVTHKLAIVFTVMLGGAMIWLDHVWLGVYYLGAWAMWRLRFQAALESLAKKQERA